MNTAWARSVCRLLIVLMALAPYQVAQAGMIGTDRVVASASQADRDTILNFVTRSDVASQLQALGLDPSTAKDRVAAMTDQEVQAMPPIGVSRALGPVSRGTDASRPWVYG